LEKFYGKTQDERTCEGVDDPESQSEIADAVEVVANDLVAFHSPLSATE
jgi:hypothetical protein